MCPASAARAGCPCGPVPRRRRNRSCEGEDRGGQGPYVVWLVRGDDDRAPAGSLPKELVHESASGFIERRIRLVGGEEGRGGQEHPAESEPPLHPPRGRADAPGPRLPEPQAPE